MNDEQIKQDDKEETTAAADLDAGSDDASELISESAIDSEGSDDSNNKADEEQLKKDNDERLDLDGDDDSDDDNETGEELNNKYLRLYAEFENFRRRSAKESIENFQNAGAKMIEKLLPVIQDFERAFDNTEKTQKLEDFEPGIKMIFNNFKDILDEAGLEEINPEGEEFDPNLHEALLQQHHETVEEGYIVQVYEKGYKVKSKMIKHAKVIISKGKE